MQVAKIINCSLILQTFQTHISAIGLRAWCNDDKNLRVKIHTKKQFRWMILIRYVENVIEKNAARMRHC